MKSRSLHNEQVKEDMAAKRIAEQRREQHIADMRWLMGQPQGRRLMHGWLKDAGIFTPSYTGNSETFYREGRRSFGLDLLAEVNAHCPKTYITMLEEQLDDHRDQRSSE